MNELNRKKQHLHNCEAFFLYLSRFKNESLFDNTNINDEKDLILALSQKIVEKQQLLKDKNHAA